MYIIVIGLFEKLICVTYCTNKDLCLKLIIEGETFLP